MSDEPVNPPEPEPEDGLENPSHIVEPTPEEIEAARLAAIAENDAAIDADVRRRTRRDFIVAGVAAAAGLGGWKWLTSRPREDGVQWPLRRMLNLNERLAGAYFSPSRLSPTYDPSRITRPARLNGGIGLESPVDLASWRLNIEGAASAVSLTLDDIRALPHREMITEFRCIEGWSTIAQWTGVRLADLMAKFPPPQPVRYVSLETPGRGYYVGLDVASAMHPQTLLAWALNGEPLTATHGAPLRLAIPIKYGVKNIKRIATIRWTNVRPPDFWAERGYDWYCGH
jgi:DMSO/TMAO reductase YedYZ molybdopterin-dependent catalytic subunit